MAGWKTLKFKLTGVSPVILHNGQLANPLNYYSKEIKKVSSKRKKTDADYERMAELEYKGSLYLNENHEPIFPTEGIEAIIVSGAKQAKEGKNAKAGIYAEKPAVLQYEGPKEPDALWKDERFRLASLVRVGQARVVRTRPKFDKWSCEIELKCNDEVVNEQQVHDWLKTAGEHCGAFDWRPKFGRFEVEKVE